jgi:hypothetical protein
MNVSSFSAEFNTEKSKFWLHIPCFMRNIRQTLEGQKNSPQFLITFQLGF